MTVATKRRRQLPFAEKTPLICFFVSKVVVFCFKSCFFASKVAAEKVFGTVVDQNLARLLVKELPTVLRSILDDDGVNVMITILGNFGKTISVFLENHVMILFCSRNNSNLSKNHTVIILKNIPTRTIKLKVGIKRHFNLRSVL
jgi:hypothetical protein